MRLVSTSARWTVESVRKDADRNYLFGDNLEGWGAAGQACIRGLPNAFGVPTKKRPAMEPDSFMSDDEYEENALRIDAALAKVPRDKPLVVSKQIGKGLAKMDEKAPRTYAYLIQAIKNLRSGGRDG